MTTGVEIVSSESSENVKISWRLIMWLIVVIIGVSLAFVAVAAAVIMPAIWAFQANVPGGWIGLVAWYCFLVLFYFSLNDD